MLKGRDLYSIARKFLEEEFDLELDIPIFINPKLKRVLGYFKYNRVRGSQKIEINKEFMEYATDEEVIDVLKHELVHYALFELGEPFMDKDAHFKETLDRLGVGRTRTIALRGNFYLYGCPDCNKSFYRKNKQPKGRYCCRHNHPIVYLGIYHTKDNKNWEKIE